MSMQGTTRKSRFSNKVEKIFWTITLLLPVIVYLTIYSKTGASAPSFFAFLETFSPFPYVANIFDSITEKVFGETFALTNYLSYMVGVELFHIFYDVVVFIPRLAHKWISKAVQDD